MTASSILNVCQILQPRTIAIRRCLRSLGISLHVILTYDEETGCFGAEDICKYLRQAIPTGSFCLLGEPTQMRPIIAHKGIKGFRGTVNGSEGHAATIATKSNAIHFASDLVQYLLQKATDYSTNPSTGNYLTPYSTVQVGLINGGQARNMIAKQCELEFEFRHVPEDSSDQFMTELETYLSSKLIPKLIEKDESAAVRIDILSDVPAFKAVEEGRFINVLKSSLGSPDVGYWDGVTEAGYYSMCGLDTIVCGPGSIEQAHQPNEYILLEELRMCEVLLPRLITQMEAGKY